MKMNIPFSMMYHGLLLATSGLYTGMVAADPIPPDAGQTLQQLQSVPLPVPAPATVQPLDVQEAPSSAIAATNETRFLVKQIHVQGSTVFSATELESLLVTLRDTEQSMTDLTNAARLLTNFYRHHGYPVARAYLPAQTITNGEVTINILEGRLGRIEVKNHSSVADARLRSLVSAHVAEGRVLTTASINHSLLLLNDLPGVERIQGVLQAGDTVGTSNLVVNVPAGKRYNGQVVLDNNGNRYTGQDRLSGYLIVNSPLGMGDRLDLRASVSNEDLAYGRVLWDAPVADNGLRLGVDLSYSRYVLGDTFASLDVHGTAQTVALQGSYPLVLKLKKQVRSTLSLEQRRLHDVIGVSQTDTNKTIKDVVLAFSGEQVGNAKVSSWRVAATVGQLDITTPAALNIDQASARTNGNYNKLLINANTLIGFSPKISGFFAINAQQASKNLDSSEKLALGGVNAVRAYPSGEGLGDNGWQGTAELRYNLLPSLQCLIFYDVGGIDINQTAYVANANNSRHLSGEGIGFNASPSKSLALKFSVAWRSGEEPVSDKDQKPRVWAQGIYKF